MFSLMTGFASGKIVIIQRCKSVLGPGQRNVDFKDCEILFSSSRRTERTAEVELKLLYPTFLHLAPELASWSVILSL